MRFEILKGTTHSLNKYHRIGRRNGFTGSFMMTNLVGINDKLKTEMIADGARGGSNIKDITRKKMGVISQEIQSLAQLSQGSHNMYKDPHFWEDNGRAGYITMGSTDGHVNSYYVDSTTNNILIDYSWLEDGLVFDTVHDEVWDSGLPGGSSVTGDKKGTAIQYTIDGYGSAEWGFFSDDPKYFKLIETTNEDLEIMPVVSLKDDGNNEEPYYKLPKTDNERKIREETLKAINIDLEEISKSIFEVKPIPDMSSNDWKTTYGKEYAHSRELHEQFATETDYYNYLKTNADTQAENSKQLSDAHIGFFATPGKLDVISAFAAIESMWPILEKYTGAGNVRMTMGTLKQEWIFRGVRLTIKYTIHQ